MAVKLSPEREAQILAEHHAKSAAIQAEQQAALEFFRAQKERINNHMVKVIENMPIHASKTEKTCYVCGDEIPRMTKHHVASKIRGNKFADLGVSMASKHYCAKCRPLKEEKA